MLPCRPGSITTTAPRLDERAVGRPSEDGSMQRASSQQLAQPSSHGPATDRHAGLTAALRSFICSLRARTVFYMLCDVPRYFADPDAGTGADTTGEAERIGVVRIWAQGDSCAAMSRAHDGILRPSYYVIDMTIRSYWISLSRRRPKPCAFVKSIVLFQL